ncbi:Oidioi.mRNA.OKI2018_I69.chr2.g7252.t1.cds [Oikopleura dioica]|uniref:chitinase n=1 Tax=Oikopleura dioica TaxID=34765 RepID=A0ABN7TEN0_OIKDI|nr:Oidioi.mRNA.OKI2018_I69.chr2.g7252.t1.cds [Oikopleura dioica]
MKILISLVMRVFRFVTFGAFSAVVRGQGFTTECLNDFIACMNSGSANFWTVLQCFGELMDPECVLPVPDPRKCEVDGLFRHWKKCDRFFQCNGGIRSSIMRCPVTLLFNQEKGYCDWPDNVDCGSLKTPKPIIPDPADYTEDASCPDGVSKNEADCFGFNSCVGNLKWEMKCPANLMFNTLENVCDYKANVCAKNAASNPSCCA